MPAKPAKAFDVWFVTANTVYKGVPYNVIANWVQEGRLAGTDMVRPTGTEETWQRVADHELLVDFLPRPTAKAAPVAAVSAVAAAAAPAADGVVPVEVVGDTNPVELPDPAPARIAGRIEEDDEVDMIPLIDISMVLLVFFIMIQAAGALAPVDVPEMRYAGELKADPEAITITIEKLTAEDVYYSVRVGPAPPLPKHDQLKTPEDAIDALKDTLRNTTRPPEVRIACRKDLPRERVYELRQKLELLRKDSMINSTVATVVEAAEK